MQPDDQQTAVTSQYMNRTYSSARWAASRSSTTLPGAMPRSLRKA
jgi:hypothetical protein